MNLPMQPVSAENVAQEFLCKVDAGWPERRLLEEIGKLSCDELAAVLVQWYRYRFEGQHASN
jgi:hypothetical protein